MNALLSFFRRKQGASKSPQPKTATSTVVASQAGAGTERLKEVELYYRPSLIAELERDHVVLLQQFEALIAAHRGADHDASIEALNQFTASLRAHLLKENLHLYVYLKHALSRDTESSSLMSSMRKEMQEIGKALNHFVTSYTSAPWNSSTRERFSRDIEQIGEILSKRISDEEKVLYPLYMPPSHYEHA